MKKHSTYYNLFPLALISALCWLSSCSKFNNGELGDTSPGLIEIAVSDIAFDSEQTLGNRAATAVESTIQRNTIKLSDEFLMVAELHPEDPASVLKNGYKAALDTTDLGANIRYRVLVFNQAGAFVTERDYIRGQEGNTPALELDGGSTYTFVVVSLGSTGVIPATTPAIATRTLANSQIRTTTGVNALMYYQHTMTVNGNSINRLDILLKHRKPLITVTINAAQTGYNITAASGRFDPHNNGMLINLSDGSHTQSGTEMGVTVAFNTVGSQTIVNTSSNFINAPDNNSTSFTLNSITIGSITATNLVPFTALNVTAGVRYNLLLNIVPNDQYIIHEGLPAARINGVIWARHNVGVDPTVDPDATPITSSRHGNYYQWGRQDRSASGTGNTANPFRSPNNTAATTWNLGTEEAPIKGTADPCPVGYRIPTTIETDNLIASTASSNVGTFVTSREVNNNFSAAKVLTSLRNTNVQLTLPAQGVQNTAQAPGPYDNRGIFDRARNVTLWTSRLISNQTAFLVGNSNSVYLGTGTNPANARILSRPIRCVGILQ